MRDCSRRILRREFLKKGVNCGAVIAALPILQSLSFPAFLPDFFSRYEGSFSKESGGKLLEIAPKYSSEFGDLGLEKFMDCQNPNLAKEE